jgi:hypothetical protein
VLREPDRDNLLLRIDCRCRSLVDVPARAKKPWGTLGVAEVVREADAPDFVGEPDEPGSGEHDARAPRRAPTAAARISRRIR